jgi:hypothetical protein
MANLWINIQTAMAAELKLVHLIVDSAYVAIISRDTFGFGFNNKTNHEPARYDMSNIYADRFFESGSYHFSGSETIQAIRFYAQSEIPVDRSKRMEKWG